MTATFGDSNMGLFSTEGLNIAEVRAHIDVSGSIAGAVEAMGRGVASAINSGADLLKTTAQTLAETGQLSVQAAGGAIEASTRSI